MALELWDTARGNLLGKYETAEAANAAIESLAEHRGFEFVANVALAVEYKDGRTELIATGPDLLRRLTDVKLDIGKEAVA